MFSYACDLLKMNASSTDFQECFKDICQKTQTQIFSDTGQCECS